MSNPMMNVIRVNTNDETFEKMVSYLLRDDREHTRFGEIAPVPADIPSSEVQNWKDEHWGSGCEGYVVEIAQNQTISFETNFAAATVIIKEFAKVFSDFLIEYCYDYQDEDDCWHWIVETYENGALVSKEDYPEDEDEEEDEEE